MLYNFHWLRLKFAQATGLGNVYLEWSYLALAMIHCYFSSLLRGGPNKANPRHQAIVKLGHQAIVQLGHQAILIVKLYRKSRQ